ncbi:hypothetical protein WUBG_08031, partial [Wuchereria bancrofti]
MWNLKMKRKRKWNVNLFVNLHKKLTDKLPGTSCSDLPKISQRNRSTPDATSDDNITMPDTEEEISDTDFEDEDELEPEQVSESEKPPKPNHDIRFKEPEKQKTKRLGEPEEPQKLSSPATKKPKPGERANSPKTPTSKKPITSEKPSVMKEPVKPTKDDPKSNRNATLPKSKNKSKIEPKNPNVKPQEELEKSDEELEPELVSIPTSKKPDIKLKDPEGGKPKRPLKVKPTGRCNSSDIETEKKPNVKPQEPDDEELEPELVSTPTSKKPDIKLKDPEGRKPKRPLKVKPTEGSPEPETDATLPLSKPKKKPQKEAKKPSAISQEEPEKPDDEELEPESVSEPKRPNAKSGKPRAIKPKNPLKVKLTEDSPEPETDATLPLPKKKPRDKEPDESEEPDEVSETSFTVPELPIENENENNENVSPKRKPKQKKKKSKPQWIPPPRPQPEPYEMPPKEKKLADILKEEKIPPTKRYARKPQHLDVFIPFEIPWENSPALQTQEGMGAFGHTRGANIKVDQGSKHLVQGDLHSETLIPLFSQAVGDNRSGMLPFGSYRRNVSDIIDNHKFDESKIKESNRFIPKLMQGAIQPQNAETLFGQIRNQTPHVKYLDYMSPSCDPESHSFISRQFAPTSTEKAGSTIIDRRRNVIANAQGSGNDIGVFDRASESIMPLLFNVQDIYLKGGTDFGAFRPLISESEGGYWMTLDDEIKCKLVVPYQ